ncbi:hypothetical protein FL857_02225 [Criibacterium bergeronii]|uniref:Uncharacterized protein n=1 Tax=Criibacterium bergeronii TaxID=1871336 RepID=A0A552VD07_9FIRM|nr:UPF0489 family protein [Criibacterium bergeronii]TRW28300.1 hypothetical protein FL857_02225 [Criibacterium bergeronii]
MYGGFYIEQCCGNNFFSYDKREDKKIYVAPLIKIEANLSDVKKYFLEGNSTAFAEFDEEKNKLIQIKGIKNFLYFEHLGKKIYIFDNHNHAFYFIKTNYSGTPLPLIHFDQHKDMREPNLLYKEFIKKNSDNAIDLDLYYTNYELNVGNFIVPLLKENIISEVKIIDSSYKLEEINKQIMGIQDAILDIDLDFFSRDMEYLNDELKIAAISRCFDRASIVTIATSPYFIEFERAKKYLFEILKQTFG